MQLSRKLSQQEMRLLQILVGKSSMSLPENWQEAITARSMNDGGMGSLLLIPNDIISDNRLFGKQASECTFMDEYSDP